MSGPHHRREHNRYQRRVFDNEVDFFRRPVPADVERRTAEIVAAAGLKAGERVLDAGTGVGVLIPHIRRFGVKDIVACDLSERMLAEARKRHPGVRFWCGDVIDLPSGLGPFDAVFFNAVFGNVWDQQKTLDAASGYLANHGRLVISHPMGAAFARALGEKDPKMVPHDLPGKAGIAALIRGLPFIVQAFRDEENLYLCVLERVSWVSPALGDPVSNSNSV